MSAAIIIRPVAQTSLAIKARITGTLFVLAAGTAVFGASFSQRGLGMAAILVAVGCYLAANVMLYEILKTANRPLAALALLFNFLGLACEALQVQPGGVEIAMVSHGLFCLFAGAVIFKSGILPKSLGSLMAYVGLAWLLYFLPSLAELFSPYLYAFGVLGETTLMFWLLIFGAAAPPEAQAREDLARAA